MCVCVCVCVCMCDVYVTDPVKAVGRSQLSALDDAMARIVNDMPENLLGCESGTLTSNYKKMLINGSVVF